jgi:3-phenylpropionate/trans-cinnamate dioxygenase ferredoxin component
MLHYAMEFEDLVQDFKKRVVIEGTPILLTLLADKVYAIHDKCTHLGSSLVKGEYEQGIVTCKSHGAQFETETGEVLQKAHIGFIKMPTKNAKTYKTLVKDKKIFIEF